MNKLADTKFQLYYRSLTKKQQEQYAKRAQSTTNSMRANFIRPLNRTLPGHRKFFKSTNSQPDSKKMLILAKASRGAVAYEDMLDHFYRL